MRLLACLFLLAAACSSNAPKPTTTPQPTTTPTGTAKTAQVAVALRPGTKVVQTIHADMDGDGIDEIAVWSQAEVAPEGSPLRQSYVDVFSAQSGTTKKVLDAGGSALTVDPKVVGQQVQFFRFVTFNGHPDLVLGVLNEGAGAGPLDLWVWSWGTPLRQEFRYSTTVDGNLALRGNQVTLDTGSYKPSDPMCCPSGMSHIVIGNKDGKIGIVSETTTKS